MNRSFRAPESRMKAASVQQLRQQGRNDNLGTVKKEKEEELALFLEMRRREKERNTLFLHSSDDSLDVHPGSKPEVSPISKIVSSKVAPAPARKTAVEEFLNSDNDKNDYDWLLTPPGTPLFPSLEKEAHKTAMSQFGTPKARPTSLKTRLADTHMDLGSRGILTSRQATLSPGYKPPSAGIRRPSSSGGLSSTASRPSTPTGRPTLIQPAAKPSRPSTPTSRAMLPSSRQVAPPVRSSTPSARSSISARSSTPTSRPSVPPSKSMSRSSTPTRRPSTPTSASSMSAPPSRSSSVTRSGPTAIKNPVPSHGTSPTVKSRPWKPSEMPGFSLDAPPNLRTSMPERPASASRGRPAGPSARSASVEPGSNVRPRRQSCSPSRGRPATGSIYSNGGSVYSASRAHSNGNDNISPVLIGTKMVERVINMRKLAPPRQDDPRSRNNLIGKSTSLDSSGFGRSLSKKSLDMAMRHMDIRRSVPGTLRPLMTNIPASSMYSVRSGPARSRTGSVSDSPLATCSNASSESVNNNMLFIDNGELDDDLCSGRTGRSPPASRHGR